MEGWYQTTLQGAPSPPPEGGAISPMLTAVAVPGEILYQVLFTQNRMLSYAFREALLCANEKPAIIADDEEQLVSWSHWMFGKC